MSRPLYPLERELYTLHTRLGVPQGRSERVRKISPQPVFDPRTVQPVASCYADCAMPTPSQTSSALQFCALPMKPLVQISPYSHALHSQVLLPQMRSRRLWSLHQGRPATLSDIVTSYGLDGPGIESRCGRDFQYQSTPALEPTQPPVQRVPRLVPGVKSAEEWR